MEHEAVRVNASSQLRLVSTSETPVANRSFISSCSARTTTHPGGDNTRGQEINDVMNGDEELGDESFR